MPNLAAGSGVCVLNGNASSVGTIPGHFDIFCRFDHERKSNPLPVQSGKFLGGLDVLDR